MKYNLKIKKWLFEIKNRLFWSLWRNFFCVCVLVRMSVNVSVTCVSHMPVSTPVHLSLSD